MAWDSLPFHTVVGVYGNGAIHDSGTARVSLMEASMIHYRSRKSWRNFGVSSPLFPSIWGPKSGLLVVLKW